MPADNEHIQCILSGELGRLILNRPGSRNAISRQMWLEIPERLSSLQNDGARIVVLESVGDSFAAGADLRELVELTDFQNAAANWEAISGAIEFLNSFGLPTVAAIDGPCLGGGCLLAAACDLRYASGRSKFSLPVARLGIVLDDGNLRRLASLIGQSRVRELLFTARVIDSQTALAWGLVNDVFEPSDFKEKLKQLVVSILANSSLSIREAKSSFARFAAAASSIDPENQRMVVESYLGAEFKERISRLLRRE